MTNAPRFLVPGCVVLAVVAVVGRASQLPITAPEHAALLAGPLSPDDSVAQAAASIDRVLESEWDRRGIIPAEPAHELTILRRLSLSLHGTIPSLEEIREFEADDQPNRLARWTDRMLSDNRFHEYFAERLARALVGVEDGAFVVYRRDRFTEWLSEQLREGTPYDHTVRNMIADSGLWTGVPQTNFITAAVVEGDVDENKLAGRCVRAFLGQRMDCAQCHDHPFADWKQQHFEGIAAHFGRTKLTIVGVEDRVRDKGKEVQYIVEDRLTLEDRVVEPDVPFGREWWPEEGSHRQKLAEWITHPENVRFERAVANRVWGLLFGRAYLEPVDDLPDPDDPAEPDVLDLLGSDFRRHNCDLKRLIRVIAGTRAFQMESALPNVNAEDFDRWDAAWAVFPVVRLRPEQMIGAMIQAASLKTIDQHSHLLVRMVRFFRENDFIAEYGDLGEDELDGRSGTIPQALLRMNGNLPQEMTKPTPFTASGRISGMTRTSKQCLETCYLVCLTRRPAPEECDHFLPQLDSATKNDRSEVIEDVFWTLFNSPEFAWNH